MLVGEYWKRTADPHVMSIGDNDCEQLALEAVAARVNCERFVLLQQTLKLPVRPPLELMFHQVEAITKQMEGWVNSNLPGRLSLEPRPLSTDEDDSEAKESLKILEAP